MARHKKTGLDWFKHDVGLSGDEKIEALEALYGNDGYAVYNKLLERIYKQAGQLDISDAEIVQVIAKKCNVDLDRFNKILQFCLKIDLFDNKIFSTKKILTSTGIKNRVKPILKKRADAAKKYKINSDAEKPQKKGVSVESEHIEEKSRVEKSRVENIIIKTIDDLPEIPDWVPTKEFKNWIQMKISSGMKITTFAIDQSIARLQLLKNAGQNIEEVLNRAIEGGWSTIHPINSVINNKKSTSGGLDNNELREIQ